MAGTGVGGAVGLAAGTAAWEHVAAMKRKSKADTAQKALEYLEKEVWPKVPANLLGKGVSKDEQEEILGFGPDGF